MNRAALLSEVLLSEIVEAVPFITQSEQILPRLD
jgi:hypothetical protein